MSLRSIINEALSDEPLKIESLTFTCMMCQQVLVQVDRPPHAKCNEHDHHMHFRCEQCSPAKHAWCIRFKNIIEA